MLTLIFTQIHMIINKGACEMVIVGVCKDQKGNEKPCYEHHLMSKLNCTSLAHYCTFQALVVVVGVVDHVFFVVLRVVSEKGLSRW